MDDKEPNETENEPDPIPIGQSGEQFESCSIGDIALVSCSISAIELAQLAVNILADKNVKAYLRVVENKKIAGSYTG